MRFSPGVDGTLRSTGERKGNDNGNATEGIIEGMVENENVPLLLKPIIKNKNRAHADVLCYFISRRPCGGAESSRSPLASFASV